MARLPITQLPLGLLRHRHPKAPQFDGRFNPKNGGKASRAREATHELSAVKSTPADQLLTTPLLGAAFVVSDQHWTAPDVRRGAATALVLFGPI